MPLPWSDQTGQITTAQVNAKHCVNGERPMARLICSRKELDQAIQLRPRHNKIHLIKKLTRTRSHGDQFKSGEGEGGLFDDVRFKSGTTMTFAELP
jgi:hypothetical protein